MNQYLPLLFSRPAIGRSGLEGKRIVRDLDSLEGWLEEAAKGAPVLFRTLQKLRSHELRPAIRAKGQSPDD